MKVYVLLDEVTRAFDGVFTTFEGAAECAGFDPGDFILRSDGGSPVLGRWWTTDSREENYIIEEHDLQ